MDLETDRILALAPDPSAAAAARKLAAPGAWSHLGRNAAALWGECQGSALYQVRVDLRDLVAKCSCPSHKFPCKHGLALLLLAARQPADLPEQEAPEWVSTWLANRSAKAATRQPTPAAPASEEQQARQAKRAEKRLLLVDQGLDSLDLWLQDLIRAGLAGIELQKASFWEKQAARLVDNQAPGLAARVRRLALIPGSSPHWPEQLLRALGSLALLIAAFRHLDGLKPGLRADVRSLIGWNLKEEEVVAHGDLVTDRWLALGQLVEDDDRLCTQRTWFHGTRSNRPALVLQFAIPGGAFGMPLVPGTEFDATLAFWPGSYPLRAFIHQRHGPTLPLTHRPPAVGIAAFLERAGQALARQPWLDRLPVVLADVVPTSSDGEYWQVVGGPGEALPLVGGPHWPLLAFSGGGPIAVVGEWQGSAILPLAMADATTYLLCASAS